MTNKRYITCVSSVLYLFMALNIILWHGFVLRAFTGRDLNRLGSIMTSRPLTQEIHYPYHHTEFTDYITSGKEESFDVITIGDSFTNGKDGESYPDYLVNKYGLKVLNVGTKHYSLIQTLHILNDAGILDEVSPRVVIIESVERSVHDKFGSSVIEATNTGKREFEYLSRSVPVVVLSNGFVPPIMVQANVKYIFHKLYTFFRPSRLSPDVYITELNRPLFTNPGQEHTLLHYFEDMNYLKYSLDAEMVNRNLNNAAKLLNAKGIKLIFFAAADKYDLYYPYIVDKKGCAENPFFSRMRDVTDKEYIYLDTIKPLRDALARGEQDVYWLSDTHWSHKGIKFVCDELVKYILP